MDDLIKQLLDDGCITSLDIENYVVTFNMDLLEVLHPNIAEEVKQIQQDEFEEALLSLTDNGLVSMDIQVHPDGSLEDVYSITNYGKQILEEYS